MWASLDLNRPPIAVGGRRLPKGKHVRPSASVPGLAGFGYLAAQIVADQPQQGWSLLCNGVILFDDGGELLPDGCAVAPAAVVRRAPCRWPPELVAMSRTTQVKAQRARENREYVRKLLNQRQPAFAGALAFAEQELTCQIGLSHPQTRRLCGTRPVSPQTSRAWGR